MSGNSETSMSSRDSFSTSGGEQFNPKDKKKATEPFLIPNESPHASYGFTRKQLFMEDRDKIKKWAASLDRRFEFLIDKEVEKSRDRG